jgi:hypothetical protein
MKKHFFIIGAQRSGTTYLYNLLDAHPEICMARPKRPEPKYFINENEHSKEDYFSSYFQHCSTENLLGEKSTSYLEFPSIVDKINQTVGRSKYVVLLRNPVKRAISNYLFSKKNGLETRQIEEALFTQIQPNPSQKTSVSPFSYLQRGKYLDYLKPFIEKVGKENLKIMFFEKMISSYQYNKELFHFLNVDDSFDYKYKKEIINSTNLPVSLNDDLRLKLYQYFEPFNNQLADYLQIDLSFWKHKPLT